MVPVRRVVLQVLVMGGGRLGWLLLRLLLRVGVASGERTWRRVLGR